VYFGLGRRQLLLTDSRQLLTLVERPSSDQLGREECVEPLEIVAGVPQPLLGRRNVGHRPGEPGGLHLLPLLVPSAGVLVPGLAVGRSNGFWNASPSRPA